MLTYEQASEILEYSPSSGELRWKKTTSSRSVKGGVAGKHDPSNHTVVGINGKKYLAHRLARLLHTGNWPERLIDHKNGIRGDNRFENLRQCDMSENNQNMARRRDNRSGFTGVMWQKNAWRAKICTRGVNRWLGAFKTPEEAYKAYLSAKAEYHSFQPIPRDLMEVRHGE